MAHLPTEFLAQVLVPAGCDVRVGRHEQILDGEADSRRVKRGDLFAAFRGERLNGNDFLDEAFARGAVAAIAEREPNESWPERTLALASDTRRALATLAREWRKACGTTVVGITGTVGKTSTKELTAELLSAFFHTHRSKENFNSLEGLPLALMSLRSDHQVSVLEMAMDRKGEIRALCEIATPRVGVVLNIGATHAEKVGSIEEIAEEKLSLPRSLPTQGTAILNADDPRVAAGATGLAARVLTFGESPDADLRATEVEDRGFEGTAFTVTLGSRRVRTSSPLPGRHLLPAALAALATAVTLGVDLREAAETLPGLRVRGRLRVHRATGGWQILDDSYNSSPASLEGALRLVARLEGRRVALLGPMAELGQYSDAEHRRLGKVAAACADLLVVVGEAARPLAESAAEEGARVQWFADKEEAAAWLAPRLRAGDLLLLKGSRSAALEAVIPRLLEGAP